MIELEKMLATRKVAFKPLQSHVTDTIVLQFGKQDLMVESVKLCILRHETFDIDDLSSMQDDPFCIHCMSWLINEKSIAKSENFRS